MNELPSPATGVELYLAAIHEVLCDIRTALVGGGQAAVDERIARAFGGVADTVMYRDSVPPIREVTPTAAEKQAAAVLASPSPTKRTRARTPRTT